MLATLRPERHSELAVYSGRVTLVFVSALLGLLVSRRDTRLRALCLILLAVCLYWNAVGMVYNSY